MKLRHALAAAGIAALVTGAALAQTGWGGLWPTLSPWTGPLTGNEWFPGDTHLTQGVQPQTAGYTSNALVGYVESAINGYGNYLIGGDATTNLFQRATTGASETTTFAYGGPDRWAYWSGTLTAMTVSRDATAADLPTATLYGFKMQRTAAQTGVVQMCMAQEVESVNVYGLQSKTVELDFDAFTGANFSPASPFNMTAYIVTGTGTDEGMQKFAWGLNAGGGGSVGWAGQANATAAVIPLGGVSTLGRYMAVANIPATATELGVALCYTPVGTAGTTDAITFANIQLLRSTQNVSLVSATVGYNAATNPAAAFQRRPAAVEATLQQRYFYQINEPAASKAVGNGNYQTATICDVQIPLPTTMRVAPTLVIGGTTESATTWAVMIASTTPVVLASTWLIQDAVVGNTTTFIAVQGTTASKTAGQGCTLVGAGGGANIQASAEL